MGEWHTRLCCSWPLPGLTSCELPVDDTCWQLCMPCLAEAWLCPALFSWASSAAAAAPGRGLGHTHRLALLLLLLPCSLTSSSNLKAGRRGANLGFCSISAILRRNVRLYQVVAPTLAGRAALFGEQLDLPGSWRVLDLPYFAAPGLSSASLLAAQEAALEAAASEQAAGDAVSDRLRVPRVPGRFSSEGAPWQQQGGLAGRSSSEVHPLPDLQELQPKTRASSANGAALVAAVHQAAAMPGPVLPAAALSPTAAGQRGDSAPPGLVGDAVGGVEGSYLAPSGKPISQSSSSPFLPAAQHRLSGSETGSACLSDTVGAAAAAAAAPAGPQGGDSTHVTGWTSTDRQQPTTPHLARLNSSSTHGGQLALSVLPQQRLAAPLSPATGSSQVTANQSLLMLRAASLQLNVSPSVLLASSDRRAVTGTGPRRLSGPARALFPPVTILFAAVEGSGELLRYPALARWVPAAQQPGAMAVAPGVRPVCC